MGIIISKQISREDFADLLFDFSRPTLHYSADNEEVILISSPSAPAGRGGGPSGGCPGQVGK